MDASNESATERQAAAVDLRNRVKNLQEMLEATQAAADAMCGALDSFESKTDGIDATLSPIKGEAESLTSAIRRLQTTIRGGEEFLSKLEVWKAYQDQVNAGLVEESVESYLEAVRQLQEEENFLQKHQNLACTVSAKRNTEKLLKEAYQNCLDEFVKVLRRSCVAMDVVEIELMLQSQGKPLSTVNEKMIHRWAFSEDVRPTLGEIANCLVVGCKEELLRRYEEERGAIILPMWQKLGLENLEDLSTRLVEWTMLTDRVREWIAVIKHFSIMGQVEKEVAREVFGNEHCDEVFARMIERPSLVVSSSASTIINTKATAEKMYALLDMLDNLENETPKLQFVLRTDSTARYLDRFLALRTKMAKSAREAFNGLEGSVLKDNSTQVAEGGTVHSITSNVVHFVQKFGEYKRELGYILHHEQKASPRRAQNEEEETLKQLQEASTSILSALKSNLERKSAAYEDPALVAIFMANNMHYTVKHMGQGESIKLLGRAWLEQQEKKINDYLSQYLSHTMRAFSREGSEKEGRMRFMQQKQRDRIKAEFRHFNDTIEEIWGEQRSWNIPDLQFRDRVRKMLLDKIRVAFDAVYNVHREEKFKNPSKYFKYDMEQIIDVVNIEFFEGLPRKDKKA